MAFNHSCIIHNYTKHKCFLQKVTKYINYKIPSKDFSRENISCSLSSFNVWKLAHNTI